VIMTNTTHFVVIDTLNTLTNAKLEDLLLASSTSALELKEHYDGKEYPPIVYFPRDSVEMDYFQEVVGFTTQCPVKGIATYYNFVGNGQFVENAAWSYENPLPESSKIKACISFDQSKLNVEISTQ